MLLFLCIIVIVIIAVWTKQEKDWKNAYYLSCIKISRFWAAIDNNWTYNMLEIMKKPRRILRLAHRGTYLSQWEIRRRLGWQDLLDSKLPKVKEILLFADTGSYYFDNNTISMAVCDMLKHNQDVLTVLVLRLSWSLFKDDIASMAFV